MAAPILETPRLLVRPWRDSDVEPWIAMNADPRVMEFFPGVDSRERAEGAAARLREGLERRGFGWWIVDVKGGAAFGGVVALQTVAFDAPFTPAFEIGWRFPCASWGRGYATEAARALLRFAFEDLQRDEVVAMTSALNVRSQRVMQRLGMTYDARDDFENPYIHVGNLLRPHVLYRATKPAAYDG